jgi:hypothetical protein
MLCCFDTIIRVVGEIQTSRNTTDQRDRERTHRTLEGSESVIFLLFHSHSNLLSPHTTHSPSFFKSFHNKCFALTEKQNFWFFWFSVNKCEPLNSLNCFLSPAIQEVYTTVQKQLSLSNVPYYFEHVEQWADPTYSLTNDDILHARQRTSGAYNIFSLFLHFFSFTFLS